ncbi:hypothetical protein WJX81_006115 [Elliptochloris bilobata]|uniref:Uncharacterized protein n=1 Tax=Elliptochloris bilobata TaxID=381761 RepID=A0AAW1SHY5_9CHLO
MEAAKLGAGGQLKVAHESGDALWARHSEDPVARAAALPASVLAAMRSEDASEPAGVSMLWLVRDVAAGEEVTRDQLPGKRSLQRAAALLVLLGRPPRRWAEEGQHWALKAAVDEAVRLQLPPGVGQPPPVQVPKDRRPAEPEVDTKRASIPSVVLDPGITKALLTVWTDYPHVREHLEAGGGPFVVTEDRATADIVFTPRPLRNFHDMHSHVLVNQFLYEACLVRKDLLPQTLRRLQSAFADSGASEAGSRDSAKWFPAWFPAAYDLATEVQFFLKDFSQRAAEHRDK